jgi:hypothetical protein
VPTSVRFPFVLPTARRAAERKPLACDAGLAPHDVFSDTKAIELLLQAAPPPQGLSTVRSASYFRWRYGNPRLGYRVVLCGSSPADGLAVFRRRQRGRAIEAVICELLVPNGDTRAATSLITQIAEAGRADYAIALNTPGAHLPGFIPAPGIGPLLTYRQIEALPPPPLKDWGLTLGDVELF